MQPITTEKQRAQKRAQHRRRYQRNREKVLAKLRTPEELEKARKRAQRHRDKNPYLYRDYKVALQEAEAGRRKTNYCEVCGRTDLKIHFDHCHQRNIFRAWLCSNCNTVIGLVREDPNCLRQLIAYLERTKDLVSRQLELPV